MFFSFRAPGDPEDVCDMYCARDGRISPAPADSNATGSKSDKQTKGRAARKALGASN
jgi:hypothetical protein